MTQTQINNYIIQIAIHYATDDTAFEKQAQLIAPLFEPNEAVEQLIYTDLETINFPKNAYPDLLIHYKDVSLWKKAIKEAVHEIHHWRCTTPNEDTIPYSIRKQTKLEVESALSEVAIWYDIDDELFEKKAQFYVPFFANNTEASHYISGGFQYPYIDFPAKKYSHLIDKFNPALWEEAYSEAGSEIFYWLPDFMDKPRIPFTQRKYLKQAVQNLAVYSAGNQAVFEKKAEQIAATLIKQNRAPAKDYPYLEELRFVHYPDSRYPNLKDLYIPEGQPISPFWSYWQQTVEQSLHAILYYLEKYKLETSSNLSASDKKRILNNLPEEVLLRFVENNVERDMAQPFWEKNFNRYHKVSMYPVYAGGNIPEVVSDFLSILAKYDTPHPNIDMFLETEMPKEIKNWVDGMQFLDILGIWMDYDKVNAKEKYSLNLQCIVNNEKIWAGLPEKYKKYAQFLIQKLE